MGLIKEVDKPTSRLKRHARESRTMQIHDRIWYAARGLWWGFTIVRRKRLTAI